MSKAEDLSRQYVLPFLDEIYEVYSEHRQMQLSKFDGYDMMSAYEEGYHQAEKDLELTWEDIKEICVQSVLVEVDLGGLVSDERHYSEVLKRFKEKKEK